MTEIERLAMALQVLELTDTRVREDFGLAEAIWSQAGYTSMDTVRHHLVDMDGNPMTLRRWAELFEDFPRRVLAEQEVIKPDGFRTSVITVWVGHMDIDSSVFDTAVGAPGCWQRVRGYATKAEALVGHAEVVARLKTGEPVD